jgi:glycyl-tRNA synthetase
MSLSSLEPVVNLAKRRGFVVQSSEIYGGIASIFDYGPLGIELKNNLKRLWWHTFVQNRNDMVGIESSIIMHPQVWEASGHLSSFTDPLVECSKCHLRFRQDHIPAKEDVKFWKCPEVGEHTFSDARNFNLMFKTFLGATEDGASIAYLRPETAQGMFTNFKYVVETSRQKVPFGIAQIGKSFRNEIGLGNWLFRLREFEIAELEFFVKPGSDEEWFNHWVNEWESFYQICGINKENLKRDEKSKDSLAHYSKRTIDMHYHFPHGWDELGGIANRTDYDLKQHMEYSGKDLTYFDQESGQKYIPYVIEPTQGVERLFIAVLCEAYKEYPNGRQSDQEVGIKNNELRDEPNNKTVKQTDQSTEIVLHLPPRLSPYTVAILPLVKKDGLADKAQEIATLLRKNWWNVFYDESGSIGRRYRRQDEIGTPWCVTVDYQTLEDQTVTIRDRDKMTQDRVDTNELSGWIASALQ